MPIDPRFQKNRQKIGAEKSIAIWGPVDPLENLGIRGTYVAVDWDICTGCGICLKVCPTQLFEWVDTPGHPTSEKKAFPAREVECVQCYKCEARCPVKAIRTMYPYAFSRNPIYAGKSLLAIRISIAWVSCVFFLVAVSVAILEYRIVVSEERFCLKKYGAAYRDYMKRTPRWIGIPQSRETMKV